MEVTFCDKRLKKLANDERRRVKELGYQMAKVYFRRITQLSDSESLEDVRFLPGHFHELSGDRKGQWACDLIQPYRLIFIPHENPIPKDQSGKYIWIEIKGVEIKEITNYHGK